MSIFDDWYGESWDDDGSSWSDNQVSDNITTYPTDDTYTESTGSNTGIDYSGSNSFYGNDNLFNITTPSFSGSNSFYGNDPILTGSTTAGWGDTIGGSIKSVLNDLFTKGTTSNTLGKIGTALATGYQNKNYANKLSSAAATVDPWASQRSFYQTQAQNAVTDPYSSPIVSAQIKALQEAQDRKDAAAGRRSNSLMGSTAVLAESAKIAQAYQAQMAAQGGSNINPSTSANLLQQAAAAGTNGYVSPLTNLFGNQTQSTSNSNYLNALAKFFSQE